MNIFWFRRDLRLEDNHALSASLESGLTKPIFIFDKNILNDLEKDDARVSFIYKTLKVLNIKLQEFGSGIEIFFGDPVEIFRDIIKNEKPASIYLNDDYEPYAIQRDKAIEQLSVENNVRFFRRKDHVIFEKDEILKSDAKPFQVYTAYKNKWLSSFSEIKEYDSQLKLDNLLKLKSKFPELEQIGFHESYIYVKPYSFTGLENYQDVRDFPALNKTSHASVHLRFGTLSVRQAVKQAMNVNPTLLNELIWREFFMQILYHHPNVEFESFNPKYRNLEWINDEQDYEKWQKGMTGYPLVDAGMRELNETGYMHNRVRMITAGFLCKHLLIDWKWGEKYFASKLLDYDLSANNGNWQWAAGTGCDAAPYFRIFNPASQQEKFDKNKEYIKKWIPEFGTPDYPEPVIDHKFGRERALSVFSKSIKK
ncbi:MAG: deoxyribodipyrimidine photo-lyase [Saprospiraceae bacterium]|nr:deoxyribodipyrimidine photo-lyase [Saprospiraceae bacterium]